MDFMVIDNFLNDDDLNIVKDDLFKAPLYLQNRVSGENDSNSYWDYYFSHSIYMNNKPQSTVFDNFLFFQNFVYNIL